MNDQKLPRGILFSASMVRALMDGTKTQTRRVMKPQPEPIPNGVPLTRDDVSGMWWFSTQAQAMVSMQDAPSFSPFGVRGNRLYVKETFRPVGPWECRDDGATIQYRADGAYLRKTGWPDDYRITTSDGRDKWKPSIFMPRWASRISLEITSVRVQRLQDISEEDARAEGVKVPTVNVPQPKASAFKYGDLLGSFRDHYRALWNSINLEPNPIYSSEDGSRRVLGYESYPWSAEDFDAAYPGLRAKAAYRGKPLKVIANCWLWAIGFRRVESLTLKSLPATTS